MARFRGFLSFSHVVILLEVRETPLKMIENPVFIGLFAISKWIKWSLERVWKVAGAAVGSASRPVRKARRREDPYGSDRLSNAADGRLPPQPSGPWPFCPGALLRLPHRSTGGICSVGAPRPGAKWPAAAAPDTFQTRSEPSWRDVTANRCRPEPKQRS